MTTGCAFCCSRHLNWTNHVVEKCGILAKHQCSYCKELGHTNSRCPKSLLKKQREAEKYTRWKANQKVRKEEKEKQAHFKANSWAAVAARNISTEDAAKIAEEERILNEQMAAKRAQSAEEERVRKQAAKESWERNYPLRMAKKYGLKDDFMIPAKSYWCEDVTIPKGSFWYIWLEKTPDDHPIAKKLREDTANQKLFHAYLEEKYYKNWLYKSEDTEDDCIYLQDLRYYTEIQEEKLEWERMKREEEEDRIWQEERERKEKEEDEMEAKLRSGEITREEYFTWKSARDEEELYDDAVYEYEGLRFVDAMAREKFAEEAWRRRRQEVEQNKKY